MKARRRIIRWRPLNKGESTPIRLLRFGLITLITWLAGPKPAAAQSTIHVPANQPTIQAAIDAAANGDTVLVSDGTYKENIDFKGKAITVKSVNGATTTIIDGGKLDYVIKFTTGESPKSVLDGFTVTNGFPGGINIGGSSPTVQNSTIAGNTGCSGIGINIGGAAPLVQNNIISNNVQVGCSGGVGGGGIEVIGASQGAQIIGNTITGNNSGSGVNGGGIGLWTPGPVLIRGNVITGNTASNGGGIGGANDTSGVLIIENVITGNTALGTGGGIEIDNSVFLVLNNTIAGNDAPGGGSGFFGAFFTVTGPMTVSNNLIVGKAGQSALGCRAFDTVSPPVFSFNDVFTPGGPSYGSICVDQTGHNGNISVDPLFVNPASDFHLQATSPAIDAGSNTAPNLPQKDFDGNDRILDGNGDCTATVDMGAYEFARPSVLTLSPNMLAFADQLVGSASSALSSTITNTASTTVSVCGFTVTGDFSQTNTCASSLAPKGSCAVNVDFAPTAHGPRSGLLQLITSDAGSPQSIILTGKGVIPNAALSGNSLNFAAQQVGTTSTAQTLTLNNTGDGQLIITNVTVSGDFSQSNACGNTVAAGASCTFSVTFAPTSSGSRTGSLTIMDNANGSPQAVSLAGSATDFALGSSTGGSTTATVTDGSTATYNLQASSLNGFTGTVLLSCAGSPSLAVCTVAPSSVTLNGSSSAGFTVTVMTTASSMMTPLAAPREWVLTDLQRLILPLLLALVMCALQVRLRRKASGRRLGFAYVMVIVSVCLVTVWGCSSSGGGHSVGTPKGTSMLTITGASGGVSRTLDLTLTVN